MIPIVSIVGKSDTGKTTLIEKLIAEFVKRGYSVATIKHNLRGFDIDHEGKDSWRHKKAGARMTIITSPHQLALVQDVDHDHSLEEIRNIFVRNVDIILSEGYKGNPFPKIEVFRQALNRPLLCKKEDNLLAVAADIKIDAGVPCFDINDAKGIADLIENQFLKNKTNENPV
ncbi:MAG TPA: molybdopterin-guanine dinucleotide biosynthesis protein B [Deltaproteobacteria bacterium]|nr:molybdopterin-guanine dinucleotide biosynthesis protein B [Deltaproteobacteria bacterium]